MLDLLDRRILSNLEVTPPGMEPVVKALKRKGGIDNPWAVAWSMYGKQGKKKKAKNAATSGAFSALLRGNEKDMIYKCSVRESITPISVTPANKTAADPQQWEGPKVKVVLITEGLGNKRDMNYYGPEAMASAPALFEGAHCFLNHPSYSEERDIPERRVEALCGYFKNVQMEVIDGVRAVCGELHFDLSESGDMGYDKTCTALHYREEFPDSEKEYVGLSINAEGNSTPKQMTIDGEDVDVNYIDNFSNAVSCDIVTLPARGGKFLALVESAAGANMKNKEVRTMIVKKLQAAQKRLTEAIADCKDEKVKAKLVEAKAEGDAILKEILEAAKAKKGKEAETDDMEAEDEAEDGGDAGDDVAPGHTKTKTVTTKVKHQKDAADDEDEDEDEDESETESEDEAESETYESNRLAVLHLISRSGIGKECFPDLKELSRMKLGEAKRQIEIRKKMYESVTKHVIETIGDEVSPSHMAKLSESGKGGAKSNTDLFAACSL